MIVMHMPAYHCVLWLTTLRMKPRRLAQAVPLVAPTMKQGECNRRVWPDKVGELVRTEERYRFTGFDAEFPVTRSPFPVLLRAPLLSSPPAPLSSQ